MKNKLTAAREALELRSSGLTLVIILGAAFVVVLAAAIVTIVVVKRRRKLENTEAPVEEVPAQE